MRDRWKEKERKEIWSEEKKVVCYRKRQGERKKKERKVTRKNTAVNTDRERGKD